jgi:hypothetical protein
MRGLVQTVFIRGAGHNDLEVFQEYADALAEFFMNLTMREQPQAVPNPLADHQSPA